jgi:hypothetical protein
LDYELKGISTKMTFDIGSNFNLVDYKLGEQLGILPKDGSEKTIQSLDGVPINIILGKDGQQDLMDSIFCCPTELTRSEMFNLDERLDGMLGLNTTIKEYIIELDFVKKQICFWDSLPAGYLNMLDVKTIKLVSPDYGSKKRGFTNSYAVQAQFTVMDTVTYNTNFIFDTGSPNYICISVYDSSLGEGMLAFKKQKKQKCGDNCPTTRLIIDELNIDSLFSHVNIFPRYLPEMDSWPEFGDHVIGGYLGMNFFLQYDKVLLDGKNEIAYFVMKLDR